MNCHESQELVQRLLDGDWIDARRPELEAHLSVCSNCRELHAACHRLLEGLPLLPPALPPANLAREIAARVLSQRRRIRLQRRVAMAGAIAAGLLLVLRAAYYQNEPGEPSPVSGRVSAPNYSSSDPSATPSLFNVSVAEAGRAVAALTRRTADETLAQGKLLLPVVVPDAGTRPGNHALPALQPGESLQEVRQTVSAGLEPVTTSARRAVDLFLREIPPVPLERKPGL